MNRETIYKRVIEKGLNKYYKNTYISRLTTSSVTLRFNRQLFSVNTTRLLIDYKTFIRDQELC